MNYKLIYKINAKLFVQNIQYAGFSIKTAGSEDLLAMRHQTTAAELSHDVILYPTACKQ